MTERDRYLGTPDIIEILGCGKSYANELMHMFEARGQMYRVGRRLKVKERAFKDWMNHECKAEGRKFVL